VKIYGLDVLEIETLDFAFMYDFSPFHPLHDGFQKFTVIFGRVEKAENWPVFDSYTV
jgi:hypothetical protein